MAPYQIPLSPFGSEFYENRDINVEKAVCFLVDRIGIENWEVRRTAIESRYTEKLRPDIKVAPIEGISVRDRFDEIAWYIYLAEQSIADPPSLETDQASRALPYMNAIGRNLDSILKITGIDNRINRLVAKVSDLDPDQVIFELLVGARYVNEGWDVEAIEENVNIKTPDFIVRKGRFEFDVECKRLSRRSDYTTNERDAWLRQWKPVRDWLVQTGIPLIATFTFHKELKEIPEGLLLNKLIKGLHSLLFEGFFEIADICSISAELSDMITINKIVKSNYIKCSSSRERQVIGGAHRPDYGLTYSIRGSQGAIGIESNRMNNYWKEINFVVGAFWRCDAEEAIEAKARNIKKRLSEANEQLSHPGVVHIGIEASEGDNVEFLRSSKIEKALSEFDPRDKPLGWVFLHYFKGDAPPDKGWTIEETNLPRKMTDLIEERPLSDLFLVLPPEVSRRPGVHWDGR